MKGVRKINKELGNNILNTIKEIQRLVTSREEFSIIHNHLVKGYMEGRYTLEENIEMKKFFDYFTLQWGPGSHVSNWWEGAHPYNIGHNQGVERKNLSIKDNYSYRQTSHGTIC